MALLSKRLQAVADLLQDKTEQKQFFDCIADVGTDHGYIPIYFVSQGICQRAIAMDIQKGPLQRAKDHIHQAGLENYIDTRLSDGLAALEKEEADAIIIAGMGGRTMQEILERGSAVIGKDTYFLLQPQSEVFEFRSYLMKNGFEILQEDMVKEEGKYYPMMKVKKASLEAHKKQYQPWELFCGPVLLQQCHPVLKEFLEQQIQRKYEILQQLEKYADPVVKEERKKAIQWELDLLRQGLNRYERRDEDDL